jgi:hypothetical protein
MPGVRLTKPMNLQLGRDKSGRRLLYANLLAVPFIAVWITRLVVGIGPALSPSLWPWLHVALSGVALYLLVAPLFLGQSLQKSREVLERRGTDPDELRLRVAVAGAAGASMMPMILVFLGGDPGWLIMLGSAVCLIWALVWCWQLRHVLL